VDLFISTEPSPAESGNFGPNQCSRKRAQQPKNVTSHIFLDFEKNVKNFKTYL